MMDGVKAALVTFGVAEAQIRTEAFGTITRSPATKSQHSSQIGGKITFHASDTLHCTANAP
jgi:ferredoxin-NADP reductase